MKKSAFTLIELLVVISIIAILASIALPVFGKVMERSRATSDANNLRQIGLAFVAYSNDNDETMLPGTDTWVADDSSGAGFNSKYMGNNAKSWQSPFDHRDPSGKVLAQLPISYSFNANLFKGASAGGGTWDGNLSRIDSPSACLLAAPNFSESPGKPDIKDSWGKAGTNVMSSVKVLPSGGGGMVQGTHLGTKPNTGRINVLYVDNHIDTILYTEFKKTDYVDKLNKWFPKKQP